MSGSNPNLNARSTRHAEDDDENIDIYYNEDSRISEEEEYTPRTDYDDEQHWRAADNNRNQPAYEVLTQQSPCVETRDNTKNGGNTNPIGEITNQPTEHSDVYSSIVDYQPKEAANYDVAVAQASIDAAIEKYELNKFTHDTEPKSEFSLTSLGMLNPTFNALADREKKTIFELLSRLKSALSNALCGCLHAALFEKVIQLDMLWPNIAKQIGISASTIPTTHYMGSTGFWYLLDPERRRSKHLQINFEINECKLAIGKVLLSGIREDACAVFDTFQNLYNRRFKTTVDDEGWFTIATLEAVNELKEAKTQQSIINEKTRLFKNNLKLMIDDIADYLIVFVLPKARETNRLLLREFFANGSTKYLTIQLPHFDIRLKIHREEVPPHGAVYQPPASDRINPVISCKGQNVPRVRVNPEDEIFIPPKLIPVPRPARYHDRVSSPQERLDYTPTPSASASNKPEKGSPAQAAVTPIPVTTQPTKSSGQVSGSTTTGPRQDSQSKGSTPKGAPYNPTANPNPTRKVEFTDKPRAKSSAASDKPHPSMPPTTWCAYDKPGCTRGNCARMHNLTYKWKCSKYIENTQNTTA